MRKVLLLILALLLMASLILPAFSCGAATEARLLSRAVQKVLALRSLDAELAMAVDTSFSGAAAETSYQAEVKAAGLKSKHPVVSVSVLENWMGQTVTTDACFIGESCYVTEAEKPIKLAGEDASDYDALKSLYAILETLPAFSQDAVMQTHDDGTKSFAVPITDEQFKALYGAQLDGRVDVFSMGDPTDIRLIAEVDKKGYLSCCEISFLIKRKDARMNAGERITGRIAVKIRNPGVKMSVAVLDDYQHFTDCEPDRDAYIVFTRALKKTAKLDSLYVRNDTTVRPDTGSYAAVSTYTRTKAAGLQGTNTVVSTLSRLSIGRLTAMTESYLDGCDYYVKTQESAFRMKLEPDMEQYDLARDALAVIQPLPPSLFEKVTVKADDINRKKVSVSVSEEVFLETFSVIAERMISGFAALPEISEVHFSDARVTVVVTETGYIHSYTLGFTVNMKYSANGYRDQTMSIRVSSQMEYVQPGSAIAVTLPDGYQNFPIIDADDFAA